MRALVSIPRSPPDGRAAQRGDPVQLRGLEIVADAGLGEHPPVADDRHVSQAESLLQLGDLGAHGDGVASVALEHLDRDRDPVRCGEHPVDDLQPAPHPVAGVADLAQRAGPPLERGGRHVIQHQHRVA
jgi:hypothetical protein